MDEALYSSEGASVPSKASKTEEGPTGRTRGGVAQLGERLPCKQEAIGSNPFISTK